MPPIIVIGHDFEGCFCFNFDNNKYSLHNMQGIRQGTSNLWNGMGVCPQDMPWSSVYMYYLTFRLL